jgi:hypothetical protein
MGIIFFGPYLSASQTRRISAAFASSREMASREDEADQEVRA